ncbi:hypothetical protein FGO68_gene9860 [Halteria grandinella]|uniref:SUMO-conjugating enzyme UBC9 n=1 Tax=Halteria grandinella TaxID=5974 RepID=A0A8J8NNJ4_HALGN|nr:hypothetical protein FGO68_gene9860 [Halteria grandinella]
MQIAKERLMKERKDWRKDHPPGFSARPQINPETDEQDLFHWVCKIPGKPSTPWEGGEFVLHMEFTDEYPNKPPKCQFKPVLFHPNIYPSGTVCLSILNEDEDWRPTLTVGTLLLGIQELLGSPNIDSPAQAEPYHLHLKDKAAYEKKVREQVQEISKEQ